MAHQLPLRVAIVGVTGRMGTTIVQRIIEKQDQQINNNIVLGAAISRIESNMIGVDVGMFMKSSKVGVIITNDIELVKDDFDIVIDFTTPQSTMKYLQFCVSHHKNMVIGTTGFSKDHMNLIKNASQKIGIVYSANFSIGIAITLELLKVVAKVIENDIDINILEAHHNKKKDIPSGTALMMRSVIEKNKSLDNVAIHRRNLHDFENYHEDPSIDFGSSLSTEAINSIPIHSIRAGNIVGEHTVLFSMIGENLKIIHKADSRVIFADGALRSAIWLGCYRIGLFNLSDVLGFNM